MSKLEKRKLCLSEVAMKDIDKKIKDLSDKGVTSSKKHSGNLNFSGCASGYCMAWD